MTDEEKLRRVRELLDRMEALGGCEWGCDQELRDALGEGDD